MPRPVQNVTPNADQGNGSLDNLDQGNSSPEDPVANVRNAAQKAMAIHIDRSVIETKNGYHRDQFSDAEKIEKLFSSIDGVEAVFSLVDDQCASSRTSFFV